VRVLLLSCNRSTISHRLTAAAETCDPCTLCCVVSHMLGLLKQQRAVCFRYRHLCFRIASCAAVSPAETGICQAVSLLAARLPTNAIASGCTVPTQLLLSAAAAAAAAAAALLQVPSDHDLSLQLLPLYAAASQRTFLAAPARGSLSPCGVLLLKLLGSCSSTGVTAAAAAGSSSCRTARLQTVDRLADADCLQLLQKLSSLLHGGGQGAQKQQERPCTPKDRRVAEHSCAGQ